MITPFMIVLLIGMVELTTGLNHDSKVRQIASTMADLVAQAEIISTSEVDDLFKAGDEIIAPYSSTPLDIIVASISFDEDGDPSVDWSYGSATSSPWSNCSAPPITLPSTIQVANTSIVVGRATYTYTPLFASLAQNIFPRAVSMTLGDTFFLRPRLTSTVTLTGKSVCTS